MEFTGGSDLTRRSGNCQRVHKRHKRIFEHILCFCATPLRPLCFIRLALNDSNQRTQGLVYRFGVCKDLRNVGIEYHHVASTWKAIYILAAHTTAKVNYDLSLRNPIIASPDRPADLFISSSASSK